MAAFAFCVYPTGRKRALLVWRMQGVSRYFRIIIAMLSRATAALVYLFAGREAQA
jgi:hypothetical protein